MGLPWVQVHEAHRYLGHPKLQRCLQPGMPGDDLPVWAGDDGSCEPEPLDGLDHLWDRVVVVAWVLLPGG